MSERIKLIAFISLTILTFVIIIILIKKAQKDLVLEEVEQLQIRFNEIRTIPLSLKFNVAQAVAKRTGETDSEIKEYYSRYTSTQSVIDEVDNLFITVENQKTAHKYGAIKKELPTIKEKIEACYKEVKETDIFLKKYETKDSEQRSFSTKLKQEFQVVRDTVRQNMNQLSIAYDAVESRIENCSTLFTKSEDAMFGNDALTAQDALETIQIEIKNIKTIVNEIPKLVKESTVVVPSLLDETESSFGYIKQKGIYIDHLKVDETIKSLREELNECTKSISELKFEGLKDKISKIKTEVTSLRDSLTNEDTKYVEAKKNIEDIDANIISINGIVDFIKELLNKEDNLFINDENKPDVKTFEDKSNELKAAYMDVQQRMEKLTEPVSKLNEEISDLLNKTISVKQEISDIKDKLDKEESDVQRAKTSLIKFQLVVNQAEISVRASHLPSISESFSNDLDNCKRKINKLKQMVNKQNIDLIELNKEIKDSMDYIYNFSKDVKNLVGLSIMVENAIVFGNKFRSSHKDIDSDLSKSEFSFLNGEYTRAVQLAIRTMDILYPDAKKEVEAVKK